MYLKKLYISRFRGIDEKEIDFNKRLNILIGSRNSGKTSIVDSLLFLQKYVLTPTYSLEPLLHTWFTSSLTYMGSRKTSILVKLEDNRDELFLELDIDIRKNTIEEKYVYKDTILGVREGNWVVYNIYIDSSKPILKEAEKLEENIWESFEKKMIKFINPFNKTITGTINAYIFYYGFKTAYETLPSSLANTLLEGVKDLKDKNKELLKNRLVELLRNVFKIIYLLRSSIIVRGIDYKNAIGPSKLRGHVVDPYCSNLPWIIYSIQKNGRLYYINNCLKKMGLEERIRGVEKTIDRRYYLVISSDKYIITRESISLSIVKSIIICLSFCYPSNLVVIDDYDEYLDEELLINSLKYMKNVDRQIILTTRRSIDEKYIDYDHSIVKLNT